MSLNYSRELTTDLTTISMLHILYMYYFKYRAKLF